MNENTKIDRAIIYVDGFNFYYGCLKGTNLKWVNPLRLCENILPSYNKYVGLKYFSARVANSDDDLSKATRQQMYYRAISTIPFSQVILGHFSTHSVWMRLEKPIEVESEVPFIDKSLKKTIKSVKVIKYEEKGSDVNIATSMLIDGYEDKYDTAILISNDSDLKSPLEHIKKKLNKKVVVLSPHAKNSIQLKKCSNFSKKIYTEDLVKSLFENELEDSTGKFTKPTKW